MNVHVCVSKNSKQAQKKFCRSVCGWVGYVCIRHNFWTSYWFQTKFGQCFLCIKCSFSIEIQSKILFLIPILILIAIKIWLNKKID